MQRFDISNGVTQSFIISWMNCKQKAQFKGAGWEPEQETGTNWLGNVFHALLQHHYSGKPFNPERVVKSIPIPPVQKYANQGAFALALYEAHCDYYRLRDARVKWLECESEFDVEFCGIRNRGKRDALFMHKRKDVWLLETKTKGQINEGVVPTALPLDFQNLYYICMSEIELNLKITGVLYNIIRNPQYRQKKGETVIQFRNRVIEKIAEDPTHFFYRYEVNYPREMVNAFKLELITILNEIKRWAAGEGPHFRNRGHCSSGFPCEFIKACIEGNMTGYKQGSIFPELEVSDGGNSEARRRKLVRKVEKESAPTKAR